MNKFLSPIAAGALLGGLFAALPWTAVQAATTDAALATALDLPTGVTVTTSGDARAFGVETRTFNDFPRKSGNAQYAVMSTGLASDVFSMSVPGLQPSTNLDGDDSVSMTFTVGAAATGSCLLLDVAMGTEERVHTYAAGTPSDTMSLKVAGDSTDTEYAVHAGPRYIGQEGDTPRDTSTPEPTAMSVNAIKYWHGIDQEFERQPEDHATPLLAAVTPLDHFSSVETFEVPLTQGQATLSIADANNTSLDSVALVDRVRMAPTCSSSASAETGLYPLKPSIVEGHRGVQNLLTVDLIPTTTPIERYDAANNGWFPSGVDLRFRWYQYRSVSTQCNDGVLANWVPIINADRQSFAPTIDQKGHCLMVMVTGKKDGYRSETFPSPNTAAWAPTGNIQDGVFANTTVPTISPSNQGVRVDDLLTATTGTYTPRPDGYAYQWYADNLAISGESGQTFRVTAAQAGKVIKVRVTAQRLNFTDMTIQSTSTAPVTNLDFTRQGVPTISGSGVQGLTLTAIPGGWEPTPTKFEYQWYRDGKKIDSQARATFTPSSAMIGSRIHVVVTGVRTGYNPRSPASGEVAIVGAEFSAGRAAITGTPQVGQRLTAAADGWLPVAPSKRIYTWKAGSTVLQSGTSTLFTIPPAAAGKRLQVEVRGERIGYAPITILSSATAPVARGRIVSSAPRIRGTARPGGSLSSSASWGPSPVSYRYQWYIGSKAIKGATRSAYKVPKKYRNKLIRVRVVGTKSGFTTVVRYSAFKRIAKK